MKLHEEKPELDHSRTYCPTVLDETVKRRLVDVLWATKICQVFADLIAEAQNPKGQFNNGPNMTKLSREVRFPQNPKALSAAKDPDPPWGSSPGSAWPARVVPPEVLELHR